MTLSNGSRLGPYEILAAIGAGGMGEVYRAKDTRLKRDVAIKVLLDAFTQDVDRLARFQREAELLATLNHPNIAGIYGLEDSGGVRALVLEFVEGPTLAERIEALRAEGRGLPLDEALAIARQIADALEAAHEKGVIHRDLKPANIKVTPDGTVKVLDFGLAKMLEREAAASSLTMSPTLSVHATYAGVILGTAAYMSPEQARARPLDKRTDIWAFGCVLFEMLTGRIAFQGEDLTDTIATVVKNDPDWNALPPDLPEQVRLLVKKCLEKDPRARISDIGVAKFLMTETIAPSSAAPSAIAAPPPRRRQVLAERAVVLLAGIALTAMAGWGAMRYAAEPARPVRFSIVPPAGLPLSIQGTVRDLTISPDGSQIVYRAGGASPSQLVVRALDQLEGRPLAGLGGARSPFISPDGHWVGFFTDGAGGEIKKVSITGGPPVTLCKYSGFPRGASWGPDNTIVFATSDRATGLMSVPAGGGEPKVLTKPDASSGEANHLFPFVLPGGRAVLFTITAQGQPIENAQIAVLDLKTGQKKTLIRGGSYAEYVETGHLVYAVAGTLRAVRFDVGRLTVEGDAVPVAEQVTTLGNGAGQFALAHNGTLVYVPGGAVGGIAPRSLVWVNRQGREDPIKAPPRTYTYPRISPDGTRVALDIRDQENDVWIWDLKRETLARLTFDPGPDQAPVWTPDSRRVIFSSGSGTQNLYWKAADNTGTIERLTTSPNQQFPTSISPDGRSLVLQDASPKTQVDIALLALTGAPATGSRRAEPLISTPFVERNPQISPDGRWLAYESNESGLYQIYVRPFPNVDSGRWQLSTSGGTRPVWARNGSELFYLDSGPALTVVTVQTKGSTFGAGNPTKLFDMRYFVTNGGPVYDVSPDGQRFLMIKENATGDSSTPASMVVVEHWFEELKARVSAK
jgi:serine/threonine-protein kinase